MAQREKEESPRMSNEMLQNCKADILKFGFTPPEYNEFLKSVEAMANDDSVMRYSNSDMEVYRKKFLVKNETTISDGFQIDRFKIKSSHEDGTVYETGYFCPASFWNSIDRELPFREKYKQPPKEKVTEWLNKYRPTFSPEDITKKYTSFKKGVVYED